MVKSKISTDHTYLVDTNVWSPLNNGNDNDNKDDKIEEKINMIKTITTKQQKTNKWTRRIARQREHKIIIDSCATSHFMSEELDLPTEGTSNKEVYLPNNAKLKTSRRTKLPFKTLTNAAREADVLPD